MQTTIVKGKKISADLRADPELGIFCEEQLGNHPMTVVKVARALSGRTHDEGRKYVTTVCCYMC